MRDMPASCRYPEPNLHFVAPLMTLFHWDASAKHTLGKSTLCRSVTDQSLEIQLQRKLDQPRVVSHRRDGTESTRCIEVEAASRGLSELRMVECVEELGPELKPNRFSEAEILED